MLLEDVVHGRELLHVTADPVQFIDHDNIEEPVFHICHQFAEAWPVHILSGEALVLIVDPEVEILILKDDTGVILAQLYLYTDRVAVVTVYRFARVDSDSEHKHILL